MEKSVKIALILVGICYCFSFGLWSARAVSLYKSHQNLKHQIAVLNDLSLSQKDNLLELSLKLTQINPEYQFISSHVKATAQIIPVYTLANALQEVAKQDQLENFTENMLAAIVQLPEYPPEETLTFQELTRALKKQRAHVKEALIIP